jgi:MYXO-CTERM domain-containing protein
MHLNDRGHRPALEEQGVSSVHTNTFILAGTIATLTAAASADYYAAIEYGREVTATDFGGASVTAYVVDVYMLSNDLWEGTSGSGDTLLNVYNWNTVGGAATYFQSFTGTGWFPTNLGGPFDTEALRCIDSFVTIGGVGPDAKQISGAGVGTGCDPNFGGNNAAAPGVNAGWYNGSPPSLNGAVITYDNGVQGTLIGRFASLGGEFSLEGTGFEATWCQGLGTVGVQAGFTVVPAPGALALLGLAGLTGRRRRA